LSVSFTYSQGGQNISTPLNAGSYSVVGSLTDSNYVAPNATGTLVVAKASATITLSNLNQTYDGAPKAVIATTSPAGLSVISITYNGSSTVPTTAGSYAVIASLTNDNYAATSASGTLTVAKASATITLSNLSQIYDGAPKAAIATTSPAGLSGISITYNGSSSSPTAAGSYSVVASLANTNYVAANASGTLVIGKVTPSITWNNPADMGLGVALNSSQLNATASVAGTFTYSPPAGTVLSLGTNQLLSVIFTPADSVNYNNASTTVSIDVVVMLLADDFNDNSLDTTKWIISDPIAPATVTEQAAQLLITIPPNTASYNLLQSKSSYDLRGGSVKVEVVQPISQAGWCENYLTAQLDSQNAYHIVAGAGSINFIATVNGINNGTTATYNPATDRFWRIRHDPGTNTINFETSANGLSWITRRSLLAGFAPVGLKFNLTAGAWGTGNGNPGAAHFDNFQASNNNPANAVTMLNFGFEAPVQSAGGFQYSPAGGSWSFVGGAGVSANSSAFTSWNLPAPQGNQVAFLQGGSSSVISQTLSVFQANTPYVVTFAAAQRMNCCNAGGQDFQVYLDSGLLGTFRPTMSYTDYSTAPFTTTAGSHVLKFVGLDSLGGDNSALLDNVRLSTDLPETPTFSDDFDDNSLDAAKWSRVVPNSTWVSEQSQQLQISIPPNTAGYDGVRTNATYDLNGRSVQVKVAQPISQAGFCENFFEAEFNSQNYFMIDVGAGSMVLRSMVAGANDQTVINYDAAATRYWRLRHDQSDNSIKFEFSPDGLSWTTRKTVAVPFALTALRFYLMAGAWGTGNGSPGAAKYDNLQLVSNSWIGSAAPLPGSIEVENYYNEIAEVAYHDATPGTHGQDYDQPPNYPAPTYRQPTDVDIYKSAGYSNSYLVLLQAGEWLKYPVNVKQTGNYTVYVRTACGGGPGGALHLEVDGVDKTGAMQIPDSGWGFTHVSRTGVTLAAGFHAMRIVADTNGASGYTGGLDYVYFRLEGQ
jgi:hypothetical protein